MCMRNLYLNDEPNRLQHFVSTVFRDRAGKVFLIGNTLSRVCPYFSEWCLENVLKQKQGEIDVYHFTTLNDSTVDIAVEYCANSATENKMFFGNSAKNIITGSWETKEVAKLPQPHEHYEKITEILIEYKQFRFMLELLFEPDNGGFICFVYPFTKTRYVERVLSDVASDKPLTTYSLNTRYKTEYVINECFRMGKVFYSDNLTGSDFANVNKYFHIGTIRGSI